MAILSDKQFIWVAGGVALLGLYLYSKGEEIAEAVNPASTNNLIYRGVNAVGDVLDDGESDNDSFSLGGWLWDLTHPEWRNGIPEQEGNQ